MKNKTFAIAGVSGNTGRVAAEALLARADVKVRVIVRDPSKGTAWKDRGADIAIADLSDAAAVAKALHGVDGAYLLVPPAPPTSSYREHQDRVSRSLAAAIAESKVPHVVLLSSVGAQHESGTGPIAGLHLTEHLLNKAGSSHSVISSLRAGYFYENLAGSVAAAKASGALPSLFPTDFKFPMVSTFDIGRVAADLLLETPAKNEVIELGTPRSHGEIAQALGELLKKPITVQEAPPENAAAVFESVGFPKDLAALYAEMVRGLLSGRVAFEGTHRQLPSSSPLDRVLRAFI